MSFSLNKKFSTLLLCSILIMGCATKDSAIKNMNTPDMNIVSATLTAIYSFPSAEDGYTLGVSACYAGMIGENLIMAGGCNFPEPGKKRYYHGIYTATAGSDKLEWRLIGELPEPAAYGMTIANGDSLIFIGGNNNERSLSTALSIHIIDGKAVVRELPSLPFTIDNFAATLIGNDIYAFGGNQNGKPSGSLYKYDILSGECKFVDDIPGKPRVQPVCAAVGGKVYIWGGFFADGDASVVHTDGYSFNPRNRQWAELPSPMIPAPYTSPDASSLPLMGGDGGRLLTLSGGTCVSVGSDIICLGGVNKEIFLDAISGRYELVAKEDYLKKPVEWYRFNPVMLCFSTTTNQWTTFPPVTSRLARAGAQVVAMPGSTLLYYIGGETKPSVRTNIIEMISVNR